MKIRFAFPVEKKGFFAIPSISFIYPTAGTDSDIPNSAIDSLDDPKRSFILIIFELFECVIRYCL